MPNESVKKIFEKFASQARVVINGAGPGDVVVKDERFYNRVLKDGSLGLGEAYMEGWWDCKNLDEFFFKVLRAKLDLSLKGNLNLLMRAVLARVFNFQTKTKAHKVVEEHYNISNKLYEYMLGESMAYTCGYWKDAGSLDEAQNAKFDLICKKIALQPEMEILDLGCGFGSFIKFACENYKVRATGVNISSEQVKFAKELCKGLPVEFKLMDYREVEGKYDRVIAVGLTEHIGYKNYRIYMQKVSDCLRDDGLFLLHTIGSNASVKVGEPWLDKYIFPNGVLPSIKQLSEAAEKLFIIEDLHNFGTDYDKTLMAWYNNFENNWDKIKNDYDETFHRMWKYYLLMCAGIFRARKTQLWQIVLSKKGLLGGYNSIR